LHIAEEMGPVGVRCFAEALKDVKYAHLKSLRFWKSRTEDEGVRAISDYLKLETTKLSILDLLCNNITPLGCEFLGQGLGGSSITILKLDHNSFGTEGIA